MRPRQRREGRVALELAQAGLEPGVASLVQVPAQLKVARQLGQHRRLDGDLLSLEEFLGTLYLFSIERMVNVEDAVANLSREKISAAGVGGNHGFFDHAIGDAALLDNDVQYVAGLIQLELVVRPLPKGKGVLLATASARICQLRAVAELGSDRLVGV